MQNGLLWLNPSTRAYSPIPLQSVAIEASVIHAIAQVEITQVYCNSEENPIEAVYIFPVDSNGAVTHFHAEVDETVIKGIVKSNEEAEKDYKKAIAIQQTAFLGEEVKPDVFKLKVGFLKPGSTAKVVIGYVTEVRNVPDSHAVNFFIPTTVAPRYVPGNSGDKGSMDLANMTFSETSPAPLSIKTIVSIQGGIDSVKSPSHSIKVEMKGEIPDKPTWSKAVVTLSGCVTDMDRDFVIVVAPTVTPSFPKIYSEILQDGSVGLMAHLIPSFALKEEKVEFIVVVDRSGSMGGPSIKMAGLALHLFLRSLPTDCFFNVVGFGSTHEVLFPEGSKRYGHEAFLEADTYAQGLTANLGGTEILNPLREIFGRPCIPGYIRQLFVITDGQVSNTDEVIRLVKTNSITTRLFSVGVGLSCSRHLVEGIAKAGGGTSAFVSNADDIPKAIMGQLKNAMQPCMKDVQVEWIPMDPSVPSDQNLNKKKTLFGYNKPVSTEKTEVEKPRFLQSPIQIPPIFDGSQMTIFGIFPPGLKAPSALKITANSPDGPLSIELNITKDCDIGTMTVIHKMGAVKLIREMEMDELGPIFISMKEKIISLGTKFGITSKYTSYIAVDDSGQNQTTFYPVMNRRQVPSQLRALGSPLKILKMCSTKSAHVYGGKGYVKPQLKTIELSSCSASSASAMSHSQLELCELDLGALPSYSNDSFCRLIASEEKTESNNPRNEEFKTASNIICFQNFDGSFDLSENLCGAMNQNFTSIKQESHKHGWDDKVWATTLVIVFLREKFSSQKSLWELSVKKAEAWIAIQRVDKDFEKRMYLTATRIVSQ